jgi:hypothetical protein
MAGESKLGSVSEKTKGTAVDEYAAPCLGARPDPCRLWELDAHHADANTRSDRHAHANPVANDSDSQWAP